MLAIKEISGIHARRQKQTKFANDSLRDHNDTYLDWFLCILLRVQQIQTFSKNKRKKFLLTSNFGKARIRFPYEHHFSGSNQSAKTDTDFDFKNYNNNKLKSEI